MKELDVNLGVVEFKCFYRHDNVGKLQVARLAGGRMNHRQGSMGISNQYDRKITIEMELNMWCNIVVCFDQGVL